MGRRCINTTKSGRYMNPTDQARKEARKLELKKNKKQRQMVRQAVLKGKDPDQLLEEMEKIDQMEFNVHQPPPLDENVLKMKRKKLRDTLERISNMYHREDPEKWSELEKKRTDYEHKRQRLIAFYDSVKYAQQVNVDEIPLPQMPEKPAPIVPSQIPLPVEKKPDHVTIYSIATALKMQAAGHKFGNTPSDVSGGAAGGNEEDNLRETGESNGEQGKEEVVVKAQEEFGKRFSTQENICIPEQRIKVFVNQMKTTQKKSEEEYITGKHGVKLGSAVTNPAIPSSQQKCPSEPPTCIFSNICLPLGRPLVPPGPPTSLPHKLSIRYPSLPPRMMQANMSASAVASGASILQPAAMVPNIFSASAQLVEPQAVTNKRRSATISAKPQIRGLDTSVTRFIPSSLRIKREEKKHKPSMRAFINELKRKEVPLHKATTTRSSKDDAYLQFMKEMQGLL